MRILNNKRVIGYGSESICFFPGLKNPDLVSKLLITNELNIPKTIENELLMNKIDPNNSIHVPILSYEKLDILPDNIKELVEEFVTVCKENIKYNFWHIEMPHGGICLKKYLDSKKIKQFLITYKKLFNIIILLSKKGYVHLDLHLDNIVIQNKKIKFIDNSDLIKSENALQENIKIFIENLL